MEIQEIKERLSIEQVLRHYGISIGKNNHINCPFHDDKTPSMRVYQETGTVYCFSGNCATHGTSLDAIDFIMKKEGCTKHEALLKAKAFLGYVKPSKTSDNLRLSNVFKSFQKGFERTTKAKNYAKTRGLSQVQIGYNSGQLHHGKNEKFIQCLVKLGLLTITKNSRRVWGKDCLIFPLLDARGEVVSLYGRKIEGGGHYYLSGRAGLYPSYLAAATEKVILTESIIDAASLLQMKKIRAQYNILALYGTNGLTTEHQNNLKSLKNLKEVVLMLDGDEAGKTASKKHQAALKILLPTVNIRIVELPKDMDINELWVNHLSEELFLELLKIPESTKTIKVASNALNIDNPNNIIYVGKYATYAIKGGIKSKHLDCLKLTLVTENEHGRKYRSKVDLYEDTGINKYLKAASEKLGLRDDLLDLDIALLTDLLEQYREENTLSLSTEKEKTFSISGVEKSAAMQFLKQPNLLEKLNEKIGKSGIVGEENNRLLLLIVASSYKQENPLHALIQGSSGSGKTLLLRKVMHFLPDPIRHIWTRITDKSLYHAGSKYKHHAIAVEDWDGISEDTQYVIRELQTGGGLASSTTEKQSDGTMTAKEIFTEGPISSLMCTTKGSVYEDNMSRCFLVAVDESEEQTDKILNYQYQKDRGDLNREAEEQATRFIQVLIELLEPCKVVNPYAGKVKLPKSVHKIRRLNNLYQVFVQQITWLHQYQRKKDTKGRLIVEKSDLQTALDLLFETIVLKVDELDGSLRTFFEWLKTYSKDKEKQEFSSREVRQAYRISKTQMHRYLHQLLDLEYIEKSFIARRNTQHYKVSYQDDQKALKARIHKDLQAQLQALK